MLRPLALAGFALVALAAPIATIFSLSAGGAGVVVAVVAWFAYGVFVARAPRIWRDVEAGRSRAAVVGGTVLALFAFVVGFFANYWISVAEDLCGDDASDWIAFAVAVGAYAVSSALLLRQAGRLLWLWPLLVLGMWGVSLLARAVTPGGHGVCET